ncbi:MAG: sporulation transcriptional regulator SpoIIID [Clostridia bacterium]|nr:sporulation transcriptional regulator SpoIIID [Clostridia bacterium]
MSSSVHDRAQILGEYIIETGATVRAVAKVFKVSKSTVHTEVTITNGLCGW